MSFNIGELVKLKSGGPLMTVTSMSPNPGRTVLYVCQWIDKDYRAQTGTFPKEALIRPPDKKTIPVQNLAPREGVAARSVSCCASCQSGTKRPGHQASGHR
jgi:uncharacterized protein YodC (DUF2158 family)